jgi:hypothetical protein
MAPIHPMHLPNGTICQVPHSSQSCGSHTAHAAPIWHHPLPTWSTELPYGFHMAHMFPIWGTQLLYGTIHLHDGYIGLPYGAHCSHTVPSPMWPPCSGCICHIVPSASQIAHTWPCVVHVALIWVTRSHLVHGAPIMQHTPPICLHQSPIWHTWLPYRTHHSHMVPLTSHMAPSVSHMAIKWHTWLQHGAHGSSHMAPSASNKVHTAPQQCTQLSYDPHMLQMAPIWHHLTPMQCLQL